LLTTADDRIVILFAAAHESLVGTNRTNPACLTMSAFLLPEMTGGRQTVAIDPERTFAAVGPVI
jgi:hypothetical protein